MERRSPVTGERARGPVEAGGNVRGVRRGRAPRPGISIVQMYSGGCSNGDGLDGKRFQIRLQGPELDSGSSPYNLLHLQFSYLS